MDRTAEELIADAEFCEKQAAAQEADGNTEQAQCSRDFAKECRDKAAALDEKAEVVVKSQWA